MLLVYISLYLKITQRSRKLHNERVGKIYFKNNKKKDFKSWIAIDNHLSALSFISNAQKYAGSEYVIVK